MSLVSFGCFGIAIGILLSCMKRGADIFSPGRIYGFVWAVAIGLADLKFSRLQHAWEPYAWITLCLGVGSFFVGLFIVRILVIHHPVHSIDIVRRKLRNQGVDTQRLFRVIVLLFALYIAVYLIEWMHYGVLPLFASFPDRARNEIPIFGIHLFIGTMPIILFLVVEYLVFIHKRMHWKVLCSGAIFVVVAFSYLFLLNRLYYVLFFLTAFAFLYYSTKFVRARNTGLSVASLVGFLAILQSFREVRYAENFLYVVSDMRYSETYAALTGPYMYIVMNLENFARAAMRLEQYTFGYFSFDFLMALSGLKHWLADYFALEERVFLVSGYNTFPYFWSYYYDFGILGIGLFPALLGFGIGYLHYRMRKNPTLFTAALYAITVFFLVITFFTNALTSLNFVFNVGLLALSQVYISRVSRPAGPLPERGGMV